MTNNEAKNFSRLENWSVVGANPYDPPELCPPQLAGEVHGREGIEDGKRIRTSSLVEANGRTVKTATGSTYILGCPSPDYVEWMKKNDIKFDPENPIRMAK